MARFTRIILDTNIFIKVLERELDHQHVKIEQSMCNYMLKMLKKLIIDIYNVLNHSQYIYLMRKQKEELTKWLNTNVCRNAYNAGEAIEDLFIKMRRLSKSSRKGVRFLEKSDISTKKDQLKSLKRGKNIQKQINSIKNDVDKSILYFSLGCGLSGKYIKVITADSDLADMLNKKSNELRIRDNVRVNFIAPENISLNTVESLVRDP